MYCPNCGQNNPDDAINCSGCGASLNATNPTPVTPTNTGAPATPKSKTAAGVLAILLGALGIHNFYLGFTTKGIIQLVVSIVGSLLFGIGPIAMEIWGIVDGIMYLSGQKTTDANGNPLI